MTSDNQSTAKPGSGVIPTIKSLEEVLNTPSAGKSFLIKWYRAYMLGARKHLNDSWGEVFRSFKKGPVCPVCGSKHIEEGFLESVPGYGAGPNFKSCEDCTHTFDYE